MKYIQLAPHFFFPPSVSSSDLESVDEGTHAVAGSSATKRKRARNFLKTPEKKVRVQTLHHSEVILQCSWSMLKVISCKSFGVWLK